MRRLTIFTLSIVFLCMAMAVRSKIQVQMMPTAYAQNQPQNEVPPPPPSDAVPAGADGVVVDATPTTNFPPLDPSIKVINHEGYSYDPSGRRDPFLPFVDTNPPKTEIKKPVLKQAEDEVPADSLLSYDLGQFRLLGILWKVEDPKAMVQSPTGKVFLIKNRTKIGRNSGFVAAIREGEVVIVEPSPDGSTAMTTVMALK